MSNRSKHRKARKAVKIFRDTYLLGFLFFLTLLSAYYRGLYFDFERLRFFIALWVAVTVFFFLRFFALQEFITLKTPWEWSFLLLVALYLFNVPWAADKGLAWREFLTYFSFFVFFLVVEYVAPLLQTKGRWFLFFFGLSATLLTFLGLFSHFGVLKPTVLPTYLSTVGLFVGGRLYSTFQYPNTAASYFAMAYFGLLTFFLLEGHRLWKNLALFLSFLVLGGMFFTYSRGTFLTFPLTLLFLLLVLPREVKTRFFLVEVVSGLVFVIFLPFLEHHLTEVEGGAFFAWFLGGALLLVSVASLLLRGEKKLVQWSRRWYVFVGAVVVIVALSLFFMHGSQLLPSQLLQRLQSIRLSDPNVVGRFTFFRDAWEIGLERPLQGWGGGAWKVMYLAYQSAPYFTESTHNFYAQVFVEGGFLGLFFLFALFFSLFTGMWTKRKAFTGERAILGWGIMGMLFMGFAHSFLDINFSLGSYHFAIWFFAGVIGGMIRESNPPLPRFCPKLTINSGWGFLLAVVFLISVSLMAYGVEQAMVGEYLLGQGNLEEAVAFYRDAARFDFLNAQVHLGLSQAYRGLLLENNEKAWRELSEEEAKRAYRLSPFRYIHAEHLGLLYVESGRFEEGLKFFHEAVEKAHLFPVAYEHLALAYKSVGDFYWSRGEKEKAKDFYSKGVNVWELFLENTRSFPEARAQGKELQKIIRELQSAVERE